MMNNPKWSGISFVGTLMEQAYLALSKNFPIQVLHHPSGKEKWNKRAIETILANEKYTGTVTLLDLATQEFAYQMKECIPPIITESEFRAVQDAKKMRSNVVTDDDGTHRSNKKYSSKRKIT